MQPKTNSEVQPKTHAQLRRVGHPAAEKTPTNFLQELKPKTGPVFMSLAFEAQGELKLRPPVP
jgi:hypothetical protein